MSGPAEFRRKAAECRERATDAHEITAAQLMMLATDYEAEADKLDAEGGADSPTDPAS